METVSDESILLTDLYPNPRQERFGSVLLFNALYKSLWMAELFVGYRAKSCCKFLQGSANNFVLTVSSGRDKQRDVNFGRIFFCPLQAEHRNSRSVPEIVVLHKFKHLNSGHVDANNLRTFPSKPRHSIRLKIFTHGMLPLLVSSDNCIIQLCISFGLSKPFRQTWVRWQPSGNISQ